MGGGRPDQLASESNLAPPPPSPDLPTPRSQPWSRATARAGVQSVSQSVRGEYPV